MPYRAHALDHTAGELDGGAYGRISPFHQAPAHRDSRGGITSRVAMGIAGSYVGCDDVCSATPSPASRWNSWPPVSDPSCPPVKKRLARKRRRRPRGRPARRAPE
ncbi:uncharacterized protein SOCE26_009680 [Sorangium cellulosum]|uniref:Uncharacterized protein n=1 Tax=Sorangium cellulosum TaxID=56 RepID=A0A2L0EJY3_SORCE|nr:uncharacterized protein SOCE26_009680 [Sorangium cellulosum]